MARLNPIGLDLLVVVVFAIVGRISHARELSFTGFLDTAWPFLVACLVAWAIITLIGTDSYGALAGAIVWLVTVLGGLALRVTAGHTAAIAFVSVAALFQLAGFAGWRLLAWLWRRLRADDASAA